MARASPGLPEGEHMSVLQSNVDALSAEASASETSPAGTPRSGGEEPTSAPSRPTSRDQTGPCELEIKRILGLCVPVSVVLAERDMPVESILRIASGTIIEFEVPFDSELTLQVANRSVGAGQAVKVGENFGLRVTRIGTMGDRIGALGGG